MELFKMEQHMKIERAKLELEPDIDVIKDLRKAAKKLNHVAYKRYKLSQSRISEYSVTRIVDLLTTNPIVTVQSTRHPDAPPRTFLDLPGHRCNCEERCSELDMCVHEILGKGGFNVSLFEERHLTRTEVQGSLVGWKMPPENTLDEIIGLSKEVMDQRTEITEMEVSNVENSIKLFSKSKSEEKVPIGYLPEQGNNTKPFSKKQMDSIWGDVMAGYSGYTDQRKHKMSLLILDMQELMTVDDSTSSMRNGSSKNGSSNMCVQAPNQGRLKKESKGRLKTSKEVGMAAKKSKFNARIQNRGFSQIVLQGNNELTANANKPIHCSFCNGNHTVNSRNCEKQAMYKYGAMLYKLSLSDDEVGKSLRTRIKMTMPLKREWVTENVFSRIDKRFYRNNMIIHEACPISGLSPTQFDGMNFCISFLTQNGDVDHDGNHIWVGGDVMTTLVSTTTVKPKYVFDKTVVMMEGWVSRTTLQTLTQELTELEAKGRM